jgi:hypothetical protein
MSKITENVEKFYKSIDSIPDHRYKSWEHCYTFFKTIKEKDLTYEELDLAQLHLAFYLASWGMYRGSSFILQKDYTIFKRLVKIILAKVYFPLWNIEEHLDKKEELSRLFSKLYGEIEQELKSIRKTLNNHPDLNKDKRYLNEIEGISPTLITKIILGTIGCIPAYDRFFIKGLEKSNIQKKFNKDKSFLELIDFYIFHKEELELLKDKFEGYTLMKILDMYFWIQGYEIEEGRDKE